MTGGLISNHSSAIINGLLKRVESIKKLEHKLTKGELRELFVSNVLKMFLTNQFDVGSGFVINQAGIQSNQIDIIIYDNRILPPFINDFSQLPCRPHTGKNYKITLVFKKPETSLTDHVNLHGITLIKQIQ